MHPGAGAGCDALSTRPSVAAGGWPACPAGEVRGPVFHIRLTWGIVDRLSGTEQSVPAERRPIQCPVRGAPAGGAPCFVESAFLCACEKPQHHGPDKDRRPVDREVHRVGGGGCAGLISGLDRRQWWLSRW